MHAELVLDTAARLHEARDDARFLVPFVTRATRDAFETAMHRTGHDALPITLLYGHAEDALRAADVGIVASGTATLEAALARCPHVIFYRVSALDRAHGRAQAAAALRRVAQRAGRRASSCPNSCRTDATPRNLAQAALNLFDDTVTRRRLEALFAGFAARADGRHRRARRGGGAATNSRRPVSHADRRHRRGGARSARRARCSPRR